MEPLTVYAAADMNGKQADKSIAMWAKNNKINGNYQSN